jgi:hypothetical protein
VQQIEESEQVALGSRFRGNERKDAIDSNGNDPAFQTNGRDRDDMTGTVLVILFILACFAIGYGAAALRERFGP